MVAQMLILVIAILTAFAPSLPVREVAITLTEEEEWSEFHADAYAEAAAEFDAIFNGLETKRAKNGRLMIRTGNSGSFKFVAKPKPAPIERITERRAALELFRNRLAA